MNLSRSVIRLGLLLLALFTLAHPARAQQAVRVVLETDLGPIEIDVDVVHAPATAANFLRYVDGGFYDGGQFHRAVNLGNQPQDEVKIEVVQASVNPARARQQFPPIGLERTSVTGLRHTDGAVSMARSGPDSATSDFFICLGDQPELDFGGRRNRDGQGFAVFGRVAAGMDRVRRIQGQPADGQTLRPPILIASARRKTDLTETVNGAIVPGILVDVVLADVHEPDLEELQTKADAVVHLRIERPLGAAPWPLQGNTSSRVVSTEYEATVLEVLKPHPRLGPATRPLRFLETFAGVWKDAEGRAWRSSGVPTEGPFAPGAEIVAFLKWDRTVGRFCRTWVLVIRNGRVAPGPRPVKDLPENLALADLLAKLRRP